MNEKKFYILIEVDMNDADYNMSFNTITASELERLNPLIEQIKNFKPYTGKSESGNEFCHRHNYPYNDCCREDLGEKPIERLYSSIDDEIIEEFEELLPSCEYGFHTIKSIKLIPYIEVIELL